MSLRASPPHLDAVRKALAAGDRAKAVALAEAALLGGVSDPLFYNLRALKAEADGRWSDALDALKTATSLDPADAGLQNTLGLAFSRLGYVQDAIQAFGAAARLHPLFYPAWRNLGVAQIAAGDVKGARGSLMRAAELAPGDAEPLGQLAALAARRGDWADAKAMASAALKLNLDLPSAVRAISEAEMQEGRHEAAALRLQGWLDRWKGPRSTRRLIIGLLADVRHAQARYGEAFELYAQGNEETRQGYAKDFAADGLPQALRHLTSAAQLLAPQPFAARTSIHISPTKQHVFLMGFMRSGTTLLEQALAVRGDVVTLEEQEALALGVHSYLSDLQGLTRLAGAGESDLERHRQDYWSRVRGYGVDPTQRVFVDKSPFNGAKIPLIRRLFPEAKIVFSIRDPRDVVLSCFKHRFAVTHYTYQLLDIETAASFYGTYMTLVEGYLRRLDVPLRVYRHEDLVEAYESHLQSLCDYLGLSWSDQMLDVGARVRDGLVSSPSAVQLRGGLSRRGLQSWRRYEQQLSAVSESLSPWVERFGYGRLGAMAEPWAQRRLGATGNGA